MGGIFIKIRAWWETADRTQRVVSIFGSAFLALLLGATFYFATRPKMVVAYGGLDDATMGRVVAEIQGLGVPVEFDTVSKTVRVPESSLATVKTSLAKSGAVPMSSHIGIEGIKDISAFSGQNVERAQLINIQQGEISRILEGLENVQSASVLLNPGEKGTFADDKVSASASVTVTPKVGYEISPDNAKAMASLVSRAVTGLASKDVTIVDSSGATLYDGSEEGSMGTASKKISSEIAEARRIRSGLQPVLDRWAGPGRTILQARVTMDWDQTKEESITHKRLDDPSNITTVSEKADGGVAGGAGGTNTGTGAAANTGGNTNTGSSGTGAGNGYEGKQEEAQYATDVTKTTKEKTPGTIKNIALSVVINTAPLKPATGQKPEDVPQPPSKSQVEEYLNGYLGLVKNANGEYQLKDAGKDSPTYSVTVVESAFQPIDNTGAQSAATQARTQQIFSLLPIAALFIVAVVVLKAITKVAKSRDVVVTAIAGGNILPGAGHAAALTMGGGGRTLAPLAPGETEDLADDETWVEEHDEETQAPVRRKKKKVDVGEIDEKVDVPLEQIRKLTEERPDTVALLLKSWLTEERR